MPARQSRFWGSQPIPGRDWGTSKQCPTQIISILLQHLETESESIAFQQTAATAVEYNKTAGCDASASSTLLSPSPSAFFPQTHPCREARGIKTSDLGFDEEAALDDETIDGVVLPTPPSVSRLLHSSPAASASSKNYDDPHYRLVKKKQSFAKKNRMSIGTAAWDHFIPPRLSTTHHRRLGGNGGGTTTTSSPGHQPPILSFSHHTADVSTSFRSDLSTSFHSAAASSSTSHRHKDRPFSFSAMCGISSCLSPQGYDPSPTKPRRTTRSMMAMAVQRRFSPLKMVFGNEELLGQVFGYLNENELLRRVGLVCSMWADMATDAYAAMLLDSCSEERVALCEEVPPSTDKDWQFLCERFPWGMFLSEGAFKKVFRVWNDNVRAEEAISVMDVKHITGNGNAAIIGAELAVSAHLSSLIRRNICPHFVQIHSCFTSPHAPPASLWGTSTNPQPKGRRYHATRIRPPKEPSTRGRYQYIRMELCTHGDVESYIASQPRQVISSNMARSILFQLAYALHCAGDRLGMKHYDMKLLNVFLSPSMATVLRYGIGARVYALRGDNAVKNAGEPLLIAKVADYGTASVRSECDGRPVTLAQFTTLENTPPEYLISGDGATQGYGHDCWNLGLCLLHLFAGHAPYEEIMEDVKCPPLLKKRLKAIWEGAEVEGYDVIKSVILADVYEDEDGVVEGEPDEVLYDTLYRYLVLFGIPDEANKVKDGGGSAVWKTIGMCLERKGLTTRRTRKRGGGEEAGVYERDCGKYSFMYGSDYRIANARRQLESMDGGIELLFSLVHFDPSKRQTPLGVINSKFMSSLREDLGHVKYGDADVVQSYMSYSLKKDIS